MPNLYRVEIEEAATHFVMFEADDEVDAWIMGRELIKNLPVKEWPGVETIYHGMDVVDTEHIIAEVTP